MRGIDGRYEDGVFKPAGPVSLRAGERVRLIVLRRPDPERWDLARLSCGVGEDAELTEAGLRDWADSLGAGKKP